MFKRATESVKVVPESVLSDSGEISYVRTTRGVICGRFVSGRGLSPYIRTIVPGCWKTDVIQIFQTTINTQIKSTLIHAILCVCVCVCVRALSDPGSNSLCILLEVHDGFTDLDIHWIEHTINVERTFEAISDHQHCICTSIFTMQPSSETSLQNTLWPNKHSFS